MKLKNVLSILCIFVLILIFSIDGFCEEENNLPTGKHFYNLYNYYKEFRYENKDDMVTLCKTKEYTTFINSYVFYCLKFDDDCVINQNWSMGQVYESVGRYLSNNVDKRHIPMTSLLKLWEIDTFVKEGSE